MSIIACPKTCTQNLLFCLIAPISFVSGQHRQIAKFPSSNPRASGPQPLNKPGTFALRKELYKCGAKNQKQFSLEDTKQLFKANAAVVLVVLAATAVVAVVAVHVLVVVVDVVAVLDVNLVVTSKVDFLTQS